MNTLILSVAPGHVGHPACGAGPAGHPSCGAGPAGLDKKKREPLMIFWNNAANWFFFPPSRQEPASFRARLSQL